MMLLQRAIQNCRIMTSQWDGSLTDVACDRDLGTRLTMGFKNPGLQRLWASETRTLKMPLSYRWLCISQTQIKVHYLIRLAMNFIDQELSE